MLIYRGSTLQQEQEDVRAGIIRLESSILSIISKDKKSNIPPLSWNLEKNNDDHVGQAGGQKSSVGTKSTHWDLILNNVSTTTTYHKCLFVETSK